MKNTERLAEIAQIVEEVLENRNAEVVGLTIDEWDVSVRTDGRIPGLDYEEATYNDYIVARAYEDHRGVQVELVHVERGKVVPA